MSSSSDELTVLKVNPNGCFCLLSIRATLWRIFYTFSCWDYWLCLLASDTMKYKHYVHNNDLFISQNIKKTKLSSW